MSDSRASRLEERERFERWYSNYELDDKWRVRMNDGEYAVWKVELAWRAWCAAAFSQAEGGPND